MRGPHTLSSTQCPTRLLRRVLLPFVTFLNLAMSQNPRLDYFLSSLKPPSCPWRDPSRGHDRGTEGHKALPGGSAAAITQDRAVRGRHDTPSSHPLRGRARCPHQSAPWAGAARTNQRRGRERHAPISAEGGSSSRHPPRLPVRLRAAAPLPPGAPHGPHGPASTGIGALFVTFWEPPGLLGAAVRPSGAVFGIATALKVDSVNP